MKIQDVWYGQHWAAYLLWPFSCVYRAVIAVRYCLYRWGIKKTIHFPVPVIVVGNITVGGTGKTPLVIALAQWLKNQGYKPGLVSRGYGGSAIHQPNAVTSESDPRLVGDEAVLLALKTQCPMVVCKNRVAATEMLLRDYDCNIVISDDGLQHLALGRDIEIAVIDGERRLGNGFCLPAGPLREPPSRLKSVDFIISTGKSPLGGAIRDGTAGELRMDLVPSNISQLTDSSRQLTVQATQGKTIHAVAGIGYPQRFFNTLEKLGFKIVPHPFPDHYFFQKSDIDFGENALVIMTEKDAVKCHAFADARHWALTVWVNLPAEFFDRIKDKIITFQER